MNTGWMQGGAKMTARQSSRWLNLAFLGIIAVAGCTRAEPREEAREEAQPVVAPKPVSEPGPAANPVFAQVAAGEAAPTTLADVAERVVPAVVNISATRHVSGGRGGNRLMQDPLLREFFGQHGMPDLPADREARSLGSGVIVSADGVVLTSAHVVENADQVEITLHDEREVDAKVVGADARSDVAVLRIQGDVKGLAHLALGDSSKMRLGEVVLAVGNPFGVGQTVTMGIVSATGRSSLGIVDYEDFIQTDAAINPGNSGGALVNMRGELVGINTAILSGSGGSMGIGFAIPTGMVGPIMKSLLATGKVSRGYLGVAVQEVDRELAEALKLSEREGVLVSSVVPGSPADRAGMKQGDLIRTLDGREVQSATQFRNQVAALAPGSQVRLEVTRDGKPMPLSAELGALEDQERPRQPDQERAPAR
jgi:serine protease Do